MRIGIDARMLDNTGIGRYLRNLLTHLAQFEQPHEYVIFVNRGTAPVIAPPNFRFVTLTRPVPLYSLTEQSWLPLEIRRWQPDVMHYPNFDLPLWQCCPYIVTIHDLIYYLYPDQCPSKLAHAYAKGMLWYATAHAEIVLTDSVHSKQDLCTHFHLPDTKIQVIYPAADERCAPGRSAETQRQLAEKYGITAPYILYVGKHHAYKNIAALLHAYVRDSAIVARYQLVIAGKRDLRQQVLYDTVARLDPGQRIILTDFIAEAELFDLYRQASLFVFPSYYEGFGLPPLEAMASGVPVITSNAASLPEVVGTAALQVDPHDETALADAICRVLTDPARAAELVQKGFAQAQRFSWRTAAQELFQVYTSDRIAQAVKTYRRRHGRPRRVDF